MNVLTAVIFICTPRKGHLMIAAHSIIQPK
jgi:hypothetical protein